MYALKLSGSNSAATAPTRVIVCIMRVERSNTQILCLVGSGSIGTPNPGSLAALDTIARFPSGETASTLPRASGATRVTVLAPGSRVARPAVVPSHARVPWLPNTREFGTAGKPIAVPIAWVLLSIGTRVAALPLGGGKELAA